MATSFVISRNYGENLQPGLVTVKLDAAVNAQIGNMLVQVAGYAQVPAAANAATGHMCGVVINPYDNTSGAQGDGSCQVQPVTAYFANDSTHPCAQADVGALVYASDGVTISKNSGDGPKAGKLIGFDSSNAQGRPCLVALDCMLTA
jgi:hypothetical protein